VLANGYGYFTTEDTEDTEEFVEDGAMVATAGDRFVVNGFTES
jgi:hypothetical protein